MINPKRHESLTKHRTIISRFRSFGESDYRNILNIPGLKLSYLGNLLFVNTPQVILSVLYLTINALYTQLQVEQEWNSFSRQSRPLRVSYPTGKQVSTYRLQLPYKYSIPLIAMSILLHWLMANALFLFVMEGGKYSFLRLVRAHLFYPANNR